MCVTKVVNQYFMKLGQSRKAALLPEPDATKSHEAALLPEPKATKSRKTKP